MKIGLIKEGKIPPDNRVAFTPQQCKWLQQKRNFDIKVESSDIRCFSDDAYRAEGITVSDDLSDREILFGIKEVPVEMLMPHKQYFFFSHTKKLQPYNQQLMRAIIKKGITLIDYESLEHEDGTRLLGFGFFAGVVGAHNGMLAFGHRTGAFQLERVYKQEGFEKLVSSYFGLRLPAIKIAVTGSGRVAHGILKVMDLMGIHEVEPDEFLSQKFTYPVYTNLKGEDLYIEKKTGKYSRETFHQHPENYECLFSNYLADTDILLNGVYWQKGVPQLFSMKDMRNKNFRIQTISDVSDDKFGSVPCNLGDVSIEEMVYGVDKQTGERTAPYLNSSVDVIAVGNLPNELPKDASKYFGEQLIKYIVDDLGSGSEILRKATIAGEGKLMPAFDYMKAYAGL